MLREVLVVHTKKDDDNKADKPPSPPPQPELPAPVRITVPEASAELDNIIRRCNTTVKNWAAAFVTNHADGVKAMLHDWFLECNAKRLAFQDKNDEDKQYDSVLLFNDTLLRALFIQLMMDSGDSKPLLDKLYNNTLNNVSVATAKTVDAKKTQDSSPTPLTKTNDSPPSLLNQPPVTTPPPTPPAETLVPFTPPPAIVHPTPPAVPTTLPPPAVKHPNPYAS